MQSPQVSLKYSLAFCVVVLLCSIFLEVVGSSYSEKTIRFGMTADIHLYLPEPDRREKYLNNFIKEMQKWKPDFVIDLGDFAVQCGSGPTTVQLHDCQLQWLKRHWEFYAKNLWPAYMVIGNHDVGWIQGGDEIINPEDLYGLSHGGEAITKDEFLAVTKMPDRYYSFDIKGYHFIILDGNNYRGPTAVPEGHDGLNGLYWIDDTQKAWLAGDLEAHRKKLKVVFCHQELHDTPKKGSGEGGDVPFSQECKAGSYVDNGWKIREMLTKDGNVLAVLAGHKHVNKRVVYGGINYITLAGTFTGGHYSKVTISGRQFRIDGFMEQRNFALSAQIKAENQQ